MSSDHTGPRPGAGAVSVTALIPAFVGVLVLVCAALARRPALHRHSIHGALVIALVGAAGSLMNVVKLGDLFAGTAQRPSAIVVSTIMFVLLVFYIGMGVRSFIAARRHYMMFAVNNQGVPSIATWIYLH